MSIDGLVTSRPIVAENVSTKAEIDALFDAISYSKGACIIRMIRTFAGDKAFQLGLKVRSQSTYSIFLFFAGKDVVDLIENTKAKKYSSCIKKRKIT